MEEVLQPSKALGPFRAVLHVGMSSDDNVLRKSVPQIPQLLITADVDESDSVADADAKAPSSQTFTATDRYRRVSHTTATLPKKDELGPCKSLSITTGIVLVPRARAVRRHSWIGG